MKKGNIKSLVAMLCVTAVGIVPVFADVIGNGLTASNTASVTDIVVPVKTPEPGKPSVSVSYKLGDVNLDGDVNLTDTNLILGASLQITKPEYQEILTNAQKKDLADMDRNGKVELEDAKLNLDLALGIVRK